MVFIFIFSWKACYLPVQARTVGLAIILLHTCQRQCYLFFSVFSPIFLGTCYHLTHYWIAAADIPSANDNPAHYADTIPYSVRTPPQGFLLPLNPPLNMNLSDQKCAKRTLCIYIEAHNKHNNKTLNVF